MEMIGHYHELMNQEFQIATVAKQRIEEQACHTVGLEQGTTPPNTGGDKVSNGMDAPVKEASSVPEWQVQDQPLRMKGSVQDEGYDHRY
jgi:hypothetical protein